MGSERRGYTPTGARHKATFAMPPTFRPKIESGLWQDVEIASVRSTTKQGKPS